RHDHRAGHALGKKRILRQTRCTAARRLDHERRTMIADLKFALRQLRKSPGFTFLAVITLALGIGLNTAIFSLINDLFLRGLPFKEPGRVVHMYSNARERNLLELAVSVPRFQDFRASQKIFEGFEGENIIPFTSTGLGDAVQLFGGK